MKKNAPDGANRHINKQTDGHGDSMTESDHWGQISENLPYCISIYKILFPLLSILLCDQSFNRVITDEASVRLTDLFATHQCLQYSQCSLDEHPTEKCSIEEQRVIDLFVTPYQ